MSKENKKFKIVVVGDKLVGKDSLCLALTRQEFPDKKSETFKQYEHEFKIEEEIHPLIIR